MKVYNAMKSDNETYKITQLEKERKRERERLENSGEEYSAKINLSQEYNFLITSHQK